MAFEKGGHYAFIKHSDMVNRGVEELLARVYVPSAAMSGRDRITNFEREMDNEDELVGIGGPLIERI